MWPIQIIQINQQKYITKYKSLILAALHTVNLAKLKRKKQARKELSCTYKLSNVLNLSRFNVFLFSN